MPDRPRQLEQDRRPHGRGTSVRLGRGASTEALPSHSASTDAILDRRLVAAARRGDPLAREQLVVSRLGLVRGVASRYRGLGIPYDDLVQEGALGLLEALERYDPSRGIAFDAFARFRVRRAILSALTRQARLIRLPKHVVERRRLLDRTEARLAAAGGTPPTPADLAEATGIPAGAVLELRASPVAAVSLDRPATDDGTALESLIADGSAADPEREALTHEAAEAMREAVRGLSPRRREVIARRFGLDGEAASVADIARDLHLSQRRTRTIENDALHELALALEPAA
jgi:RNA polymerase sigma factor (sigma-70 family)